MGEECDDGEGFKAAVEYDDDGGADEDDYEGGGNGHGWSGGGVLNVTTTRGCNEQMGAKAASLRQHSGRQRRSSSCCRKSGWQQSQCPYTTDTVYGNSNGNGNSVGGRFYVPADHDCPVAGRVGEVKDVGEHMMGERELLATC